MISLGIGTLLAQLRRGDITANDIAEQVIANHERLEPALNAFSSFDAEGIRCQAKAADAAFAAGIDLGPFQGLPISVKDLYGVSGFKTFAGTARPLPAGFEIEGALVQAMRRQGALITGKTHTVEFAFGGLGTNRHYGAPRNPWDDIQHRVSGGSSSGAGVSLWQGTSLLALGSDTTGSVRMPASWTGTVGLKVSLGRWPTDGLLSQSETLDTPGVLTCTVDDLAWAFAALDPEGLRWDEFRVGIHLVHLESLRLGVPKNFFFDQCSPGVAEGVHQALDELRDAGATLVPFELPEADAAYDLWQRGHVSAAEAYATLTTQFQDRIATLDPDVWSRIKSCGEITAADYIERRRQIHAWMDQVNDRLCAVDAFVTPTIAITAPTIAAVADLDGYRRHNLAASRNAAILSLFDLCAITLPVARDVKGVPVGMQVACRRHTEPRLIAIAAAMERTLGTARNRLGTPSLISAPDHDAQVTARP